MQAISADEFSSHAVKLGFVVDHSFQKLGTWQYKPQENENRLTSWIGGKAAVNFNDLPEL